MRVSFIFILACKNLSLDPVDPQPISIPQQSYYKKGVDLICVSAQIVNMQKETTTHNLIWASMKTIPSSSQTAPSNLLQLGNAAIKKIPE